MSTIQQVRDDWRRRGLTTSAWARQHGYSPQQVRDVLRGRAKGNFGASHEIKVLLGLKDGIIDDSASQGRDRNSA